MANQQKVFTRKSAEQLFNALKEQRIAYDALQKHLAEEKNPTVLSMLKVSSRSVTETYERRRNKLAAQIEKLFTSCETIEQMNTIVQKMLPAFPASAGPGNKEWTITDE